MKKMSFPLILLSLSVTLFGSCKKDLVTGAPVETTPVTPPVTDPVTPVTPPVTPPVIPVIPVPPAVNTVSVGDGTHGFTIDGKVTTFPLGTKIVVKPGIYAGGINIKNLTGVTVDGTNVTLDGLNKSKDGFYNTLSLTNLTNVTISGFATKNVGYHSLYINSRMVGLTLDSLTFTNCEQGIFFSTPSPMIWDGTDNSVAILNMKISNSTFDNASNIYVGGSIGNGQITNMVKGLEVFGCTFKNVDGGNILQSGAADKFNVHNCTFSNLNATYNGDTRIISMVGNGDVHDNTCNNYEGHFAAVNPASFGSALETSHFYNNVCTNSRRYAAFEFQEFASNNVPGLTSKSNLEVYNNVVGNINTDHWTGYPGVFIDNYQGYIVGSGGMGGKVSLTNNKGYNWFPVPTKIMDDGNLQLWNLAEPDVATGNTYTATL